MKNLVVQLRDGRTSYIAVPEGTDVGLVLDFFLNRTDRFSRDWVKLNGGEWVRYDFIVSVRLPNGD